MADTDINAIIAQRQAIDARRKPASDFQAKDKYGRSIWNPKVGGEAAYKAQNGEVDKALDRFDQSPLGKLIALRAEGEGSAQTQNQAQIDYHKTGLGQATYAAKEAAPWVAGLPLGAAETYLIRKGVGLGPGSSLTSRAGASLGGLAFSGLEGYLAHRSEEHSKDSTLTPFQRDVNEGLANTGYGATGSNAVGSLISPFIGTGANSNSGGSGGNGGGENSGPVNPPSQSPYKGMKPKAASEKLLEDLGAQSTGLLRDNMKLLPQAIKGAPEGALRKVAAEWPGIDAAEPDINALRGALESSASKVLSARRTIPVLPLMFGIAGTSLGDAATSKAQAAGLDDREANALGSLTRVAGAAGGVGVGHGLGLAAQAADDLAAPALSAIANRIPENAMGRIGAAGLRGLSNALIPATTAYGVYDALNSTPRIPEEIRGRAWSNPDIQAKYFQELRDEDAKKEQIASAFQANRNSYFSPRAGINPNEAYERPVSVPGDPLPPRGMADTPRGAAYSDVRGYGAPPPNALSENALAMPPHRNPLLEDPAIADRAQIDARQAALSRQYQARQEALASPTMPSTPTAQAEIPKEVLAKATNDGQPSLDARREDRVREALRGASEGAALPAETPQGIEHPPITSDAHFHQELAHIARFLRMKNGDVVRVEPQYQAAPPPPQMYSPAPAVPNRLIG